MTVTPETQARMDEYRRRYEELKAAGQGQTPRVMPAPTQAGAVLLPPGPLKRETIPGGWYWTTRLLAGEALRIALMDAPAAVSLIAWNAADTSERINYADTVKIQWTAALSKGRVVFSDMGRVMFSIIEDTSGMHDALVGGSTPASNRKYAQGDAAEGAGLRNTRDNFILAAGKLGLDKRDIPPCLTFFAPVRTDEEGRFVWRDTPRAGGDFVDLRAEMDLLVALSNCPHPMDPNPDYAAGNVEAIRYWAPEPSFDDFCRTATREAARGFDNLAR
ncbi:urea amidolyase associated protein UAAP1 [Aquabacter cavernae]|uniref:urea amidolyase associated protein UAAP1 n=1 Tax=Aquabacter cavernae TaxID=2496029 RepID=UPI000F8CA4B9|nr:urea amidolyase associated protein UAAP1 [Aquabacter cavernae]